MSLGHVMTTDAEPLTLMPTTDYTPAPNVPPVPVVAPTPIVAPASTSTPNTIPATASTSRAQYPWPGGDPNRPIGLATGLTTTCNRTASKALLRQVFGDSDDYRPHLRALLAALNDRAQNPLVAGTSPFNRVGNRLLRVTLPLQGDVLFSVNPQNELDTVRRYPSDPQEAKQVLKRLHKSLGNRAPRRNYVEHLRATYPVNSATQQSSAIGIQLRNATLDRSQIQVPDNLAIIGSKNRMQEVAQRFGLLETPSTALDGIAQDVNALLRQARQRNQPLPIRQPVNQQNDVLIIDVPNTPQQPSFIHAPYTLLLRLDATGHIIDFDRGDPNLNSAVKAMHNRARQPRKTPRTTDESSPTGQP